MNLQDRTDVSDPNDPDSKVSWGERLADAVKESRAYYSLEDKEEEEEEESLDRSTAEERFVTGRVLKLEYPPEFIALLAGTYLHNPDPVLIPACSALVAPGSSSRSTPALSKDTNPLMKDFSSSQPSTSIPAFDAQQQMMLPPKANSSPVVSNVSSSNVLIGVRSASSGCNCNPYIQTLFGDMHSSSSTPTAVTVAEPDTTITTRSYKPGMSSSLATGNISLAPSVPDPNSNPNSLQQSSLASRASGASGKGSEMLRALLDDSEHDWVQTDREQLPQAPAVSKMSQSEYVTSTMTTAGFNGSSLSSRRPGPSGLSQNLTRSPGGSSGVTAPSATQPQPPLSATGLEMRAQSNSNDQRTPVVFQTRLAAFAALYPQSQPHSLQLPSSALSPSMPPSLPALFFEGPFTGIKTNDSNNQMMPLSEDQRVQLDTLLGSAERHNVALADRRVASSGAQGRLDEDCITDAHSEHSSEVASSSASRPLSVTCDTVLLPLRCYVYALLGVKSSADPPPVEYAFNKMKAELMPVSIRLSISTYEYCTVLYSYLS